VIDGDIVSSIAARYGVRVNEIKRLNPRLNINVLRIGQKIKVCPEIAPRNREEFTYTVKNGDSLSKIGEKYGLLAKEIVRLQSGKLRRRLDASANDLKLGDELTLVVDRGVLPEYAPKDEDRGTLKIGVQLTPGKAYYIKRPHLAFGTSHSVKAIKAALSRYKQTKAGKGGPQVHVGDISSRGGGPLTGHKSHQKGIDVDIGLVLKGSDANETRFRTGNSGNLDVARTWALIKAFVDTADVRAVFLDYNLQKMLYEHARQQKVSESTLDELFQYPRGKGRGFGIIRHWKGHKDHFHVRFKK
jgi:LysM repeat protein